MIFRSRIIRVIPLLSAFFLIATIGCASNSRNLLGRLQVGDAGGVCSFLTTALVGPGVGRGRNEGQLKSYNEILSLFGPIGIRARSDDWKLAATGIGLREYEAITYSPTGLSLRKDTLFTARVVADRQLVPITDVRVFYRRLFSGSFLNTDVLIASLEHGELTLDEVRAQFWRWIGHTYDDYRLDYYLFEGNQNMLRRLFASDIIARSEARFLLARWFLERTAYESSMIDDLVYFQVVKPQDAQLLLGLELSYYAYFQFTSDDREKMISAHSALYEEVRQKAKWPLTIPRQSPLRAIAPSLRNRYRDDFNTNEFIEMKAIEVPLPLRAYIGYDPRIAVSMNDGRKLSTAERLSRWGLGNILGTFGAGHGETHTAYTFERRLYSIANRHHVNLVASARRRGVVTAERHTEYVRATADAGYSSRALYDVSKEFDISIFNSIAHNGIFLNRTFVDGISYEDYEFMTAVDGRAYAGIVLKLLRSRVSDASRSISAITILSAEKVGDMTQMKAEAVLEAHFYDLLGQMTFAAMTPAKIDRDWRMRTQRLKFQRLLYEYKANRAMKRIQDQNQVAF